MDEALALRTCWPPCLRFDSGGVTHDGDRRPIVADAPSSPVVVMACAKSILDTCWPTKYLAHAVPGDELVVMDGNHRLASIALRRALGHRDDLEIQVYFCQALAPAAGPQ
jgi:hypothetical protein